MYIHDISYNYIVSYLKCKVNYMNTHLEQVSAWNVDYELSDISSGETFPYLIFSDSKITLAGCTHTKKG